MSRSRVPRSQAPRPRNRASGQAEHPIVVVRQDPASSSSRDGAPGTRHAAGVDPDVKRRNLTRLRRIEGQVRGVHRMVDDERYCADVLVQISSIQEALRGVSRELMRNHLKHCAASAIRSGPGPASAMYDELIELIYKHSR